MEQVPRKRQAETIKDEKQKKCHNEITPVHFSLMPPQVRNNFLNKFKENK